MNGLNDDSILVRNSPEAISFLNDVLALEEEYAKFSQSLHFSRLTKEQKHKHIMDELRMPAPPITQKSVQELIDDAESNSLCRWVI
jgi:hypothetical protein